jgi:hypothetical protein
MATPKLMAIPPMAIPQATHVRPPIKSLGFNGLDFKGLGSWPGGK